MLGNDTPTPQAVGRNFDQTDDSSIIQLQNPMVPTDLAIGDIITKSSEKKNENFKSVFYTPNKDAETPPAKAPIQALNHKYRTYKLVRILGGDDEEKDNYG